MKKKEFSLFAKGDSLEDVTAKIDTEESSLASNLELKNVNAKREEWQVKISLAGAKKRYSIGEGSSYDEARQYAEDNARFELTSIREEARVTKTYLLSEDQVKEAKGGRDPTPAYKIGDGSKYDIAF